MRAIFLLLLITFTLGASPVFAQLSTDFQSNSGPSLSVEPSFPKPGHIATVKITGNNSQLFGADIVWSLDGEVLGDANNQRQVEIEAGQLGKTQTVAATLITTSGVTRTLTTTIEPKFLDIVIEPQTRVPDFYKGRPVPSIGSSVIATALLNDGQLGGQDVVYVWRLNNKVLEGGSIRGTNQVSFNMPRGSQSTLSVAISDREGNLIGSRSMYFRSVYPELAFYELNALYGQSENSITKALVMTGSASTIKAEPYFLDIRTYNNPDILEWKIDRSNQTNTGSNPYIITIQKVSDGGASDVSFHVRSTTELLQGVEDSFDVAF